MTDKNKVLAFDAEPTWVYQHYDSDGNILYVGVSSDVKARNRQHKYASPWFHLSARIESDRFETRVQALEFERDLIELLNPVYNTTHADTISPHAKTMGRPPVANPATEKLPNIRLKPEQLQSYRDASDVNGQSLSDWVRTTLDKAAKRANSK